MTRENECCSDLEQWLPPKLFKALSDPTRVAILNMIAQSGKEMTVSQVAKQFTIDFSVVSRHLGTLRDAQILKSEKRGKEVYYQVRINELVDLLRNLAAALEACCPTGVCSTKRSDP